MPNVILWGMNYPPRTLTILLLICVANWRLKSLTAGIFTIAGVVAHLDPLRILLARWGRFIAGICSITGGLTC